jgi:UDP-apiose/xylose synthase
MRDIYRELDPDGTLPEMKEISGEEFYGKGYEDSERRVPNTTKLREAGWEPKYDLREGLTECIQYYIRNYEPQTVPK